MHLIWRPDLKPGRAFKAGSLIAIKKALTEIRPGTLGQSAALAFGLNLLTTVA